MVASQRPSEQLGESPRELGISLPFVPLPVSPTRHEREQRGLLGRKLLFFHGRLHHKQCCCSKQRSGFVSSLDGCSSRRLGFLKPGSLCRPLFSVDGLCTWQG